MVRLGRGRIGRRQAEQLGLRLEVRLAVRPAQVGQRLERPAVANRGDHVLQLAALGQGVVDVVGDHGRQAELLGQAGGLGDQPVVVGQEVMLELEDEAGRSGCTSRSRAASLARALSRTASSARVASTCASTCASSLTRAAEQHRVTLGDPARTLAIAHS